MQCFPIYITDFRCLQEKDRKGLEFEKSEAIQVLTKQLEAKVILRNIPSVILKYVSIAAFKVVNYIFTALLLTTYWTDTFRMKILRCFKKTLAKNTTK